MTTFPAVLSKEIPIDALFALLNSVALPQVTVVPDKEPTIA